MRSLGVVMAPPILDQYLGFFQRIEDLPIEQLITQLAIEALDIAILPGAALLDEQRTNVEVREPVTYLLSGEFCAVVEADVGVQPLRASRAEEERQPGHERHSLDQR
jgi:hypothetical protein